MKALDPCEKWELRSPEEIIERLLARSARTIGLPVAHAVSHSRKDRYRQQWRRLCVKQAMRKV